MRYKRSLLIIAGVLASLVVNSCKKDSQNAIQILFTGGYWQLASVIETHFTGNTAVSTDTLNTNCSLIQKFTFNSNGTCTYQNFDCVAQPVATGQWSLTSNKLYLQSDIVCKDTSAAGSSKPFSNSEIYNLGQYSLILITGDIQPNYSLTKPREQIQYGFVRIVAP